MQRRKFSREFKLEAVRRMKERGVAVTEAARDLNLHEKVLRKWVRELSTDPQHAFPGHGQMKPEQQEIDRLRKEVSKPELATGPTKWQRQFLMRNDRANGERSPSDSPRHRSAPV